MTDIEAKYIEKVIPGDDFNLILLFESGEVRFIDMKPFIRGGAWSELRDSQVFNSVKVDDFWGLEWGNGLNYCPDSAFMDSTELPTWLLKVFVETYEEMRQRKQGEGEAA